jgi:2-polyprenyl-3-methyl-5-hydroxy-6-metoxy-1,4-benzoquinol methylase
MQIPTSFENIVEEIVRFTGASVNEAKERVWMEGIETGWNVMKDVRRFGVTPHQYNDRMEKLYKEGEGFIYDSLVYWANPSRQRWVEETFERICEYSSSIKVSISNLRVLLLGDGAGNDSLFLAKRGLKVDYFDVPGSKIFEFAMKRFQYYGLLGNEITLVDNYNDCFRDPYDIIISFEVLEHLSDPIQTIIDVSKMLKIGGIAFITEDFAGITTQFPTHLKSNAKYFGTTPFLFMNNSMVLRWYSTDNIFKPAEYQKHVKVGPYDRLSLWKDNVVRGIYLSRFVLKINKTLGKIVFGGIVG